MGSGQGCGIQFLKFLLIFFNILFMLLGIGIIAAGAYVVSALGGTSITEILSVGAVFIVVGVIILILAFLGCMGAIRQSKCMLYTFAIVISVIIIAEIAIAIAAFVYQNAAEDLIDEYLDKEYTKLTTSTDENIVGAISALQKTFECCGYSNNTQVLNMNTSYPGVPDLIRSCYPGRDTNASPYPTCKSVVVSTIEQYYLVIGGVGLAFALIEILGVIFACCVARHEDLDKMA